MRFFSRKKNKKIVRAAAVIAAAIMTFELGLPPEMSAIATPGSQQRFDKTTTEKLEDAEDDLKKTISEIDSLKDKANKTDADIAATSKSLKKLMAAQVQLEADMQALQGQIDQNNVDLANAEAALAEEYASMKLRIQFMYENNSSDSVWAAVLSSGSFADMLNRLEYIAEVHESDRVLMDRCETVRNEVQLLGEELAGNMSSLMEKQASYRTQQAAVETSIELLKTKSEQYQDQIETAQGKKEDYEKTISSLEEKIRAEEAAAARVAAQTYEGGGSGESGLGSDKTLTDNSNDPAFTGSVSGAELVAYASQFRGNPYVWAGNSLTEGCDCSGFVNLIYKHFGYSTPRYSQAFKNVGQPVSYDNMKAGDIVVYPGHVAIYMGNGCIVEAQSTKAGITTNRSVNCHTITAIRRLL